MPYASGHVIREFLIVTLLACTKMQPWMFLPDTTVPAVLMVMSPVTVVSAVPFGTPVLLASGQPARVGVGGRWAGPVPLGCEVGPAGGWLLLAPGVALAPGVG